MVNQRVAKPWSVGISWSSGAVYSDAEHIAFQKKVEAKAVKEQARKLALKNDVELPLV